MASAITLEGIDQAISNLKYNNKNTLKYRYVQNIRQYYTIENAVVSLNEIDHEELIKVLWDTDHSPETIKNKRRNLNSIRSSVNADFKKLYEKGENPEGIKIGPSNIFIMSEDAKDKILKKLGYDLQPDGTLKLDQIMDILKLANETVSGSMAVEDTVTKNGIGKIDRLKDLIKGLSEKVGLGSPELSKAASENDDMAGKGDEEGSGNMEQTEVFDEALLDEVDDIDEIEDIADLEDDIEYVDAADEEEVVDDIEEILDEAEELEETAEIDEDAAYVDAVDEEEILDDVEDIEIDEITDTDTDDLAEASDVVEEIDDMPAEAKVELEDVETVDDIEEVLDEAEELEETAEIDEDAAYVDAVDEEEILADVEDVLDEGDGGNVGYDMPETDEHGVEESDEQLGLPVGSLGQEYDTGKNGKVKNNKLLSEEFDGYLGSMDRYYNHYILIPGGEYIIGSKNPKKDEKPEQTVYLEPFYFGRFPITNGLFEIFVEKTGYKTTAEKVGYGTVYYGRFEKKKDETTGLITSIWNSSLYCQSVEGACWYQPSGPESTLYNKRNHPVVQVSLEDAMAFAAWTGKRLPTENEWEAASRTANGWMFPWGQEWKKDACNIEDSCNADTTPVDKYAEFENDFGIIDTLGNVLEWTNNSFEEMSETNNKVTYKVVRGGSWVSGKDIRLFSRFMIESESHSNILGFRCVAY